MSHLRVAAMAAIAVVVLSGCGHQDPRVTFRDFRAGKRVAGFPTESADVATIKEQAAALPEDVFYDRRGARVTGGPEVFRAKLFRTDAPRHSNGAMREIAVTLEWVFEGNRLVGVAWKGEDADFSGSPDDTARTEYKIFDKEAFGRVMARQQVRDAAESKRLAEVEMAESKKTTAKNALLGAEQLAEVDQKKLSPLTLLGKPGMGVFLARTIAMEADRPFTAAGIYYHLRYSMSANDINNGWVAMTEGGLNRTLMPTCGKLMSLVDWRGQPDEFVSWFRNAVTSASPPAFRYCDEIAGNPLQQAAKEAGRSPVTATLGPRTITNVRQGETEDIVDAVTRKYTVQEANPARAAAMGPLRPVAQRLVETRAALQAAEAEAANERDSRGCTKFAGVDPGKIGATGRREGGGKPEYTRVQCASALFAQGRAEGKVADLRRQVAAQQAQLDAAWNGLPPAMRAVTKTATTRTTTASTRWHATVQQRVTINTTPPFVFDAPVATEFETIKPLSLAQATASLAGTDAGGRSIARHASAGFMEFRDKQAGPPKAPPIDPRLSGEAAETERRWAEFFFANGSADGLWPAPRK